MIHTFTSPYTSGTLLHPMPELPEVERGRKIAEGAALGKRVIACEVDENDDIVFDGVDPLAVAELLKGARVTAVRRHGKQLWFELDRRPFVLFHFGMTGAFVVPNVAPLVLESTPKKQDLSWPPRFSKIRMTFDDGAELAMVNKRRLGRIRLRERPEEESPIRELGFDPYLELPKLADFRALLARRSVTLKGLLLDQSFAAGVGNWIADEVLYQAKLDPRRKVDALSAAEQKALHGALKKVVHKAVAVEADKTRFPKNWLFHRRWGKDKDAVTVAGDAIVHATIAGRTTAWVPAVQK
ncbi:MAG: DNA-formamidopyrimidine glycosylase family protein [Deltaproteobacteria bacterium]|jgi:formamidopyrimidine-DNA glycosylase